MRLKDSDHQVWSKMALARETLKSLRRHVSVRQTDVFSRGLGFLALGNVSETVGLRNLSTTRTSLQESQLEADIAASDPAPGFQMFGSTAPKVPRFSIVPPTLQPAAVAAPTPVAQLDGIMLAREMSNSLSHGRMEETVRIFDEWVKITDAAGNPNKPNLLVYNLLLHAKLRLGAHPDSMHRIITEMESAGINPTQLTYNFVLRAIFRQRNSRLAEQILEK